LKLSLHHSSDESFSILVKKRPFFFEPKDVGEIVATSEDVFRSHFSLFSTPLPAGRATTRANDEIVDDNWNRMEEGGEGRNEV